MADNYTNVSISGYNANPPSDDGTQATQNEVAWSKHKDKLGDPLKTAIESIDTNVDAAITALEAFLPPGVIVPYAASTAPNTNWVLCDGASYNSVTDGTFANLFTIIGTDYGGTGASAFNVPDLRGRFVRGTDNGAGIDPDAASRVDRGDGTTGDNVGTGQSFALEAHGHTVSDVGHTHGPGLAGAFYQTAAPGNVTTLGAGTGAQASGATANATTGIAISDGSVTGATTASAETRPKNIGLNFLIKK